MHKNMCTRAFLLAIALLFSASTTQIQCHVPTEQHRKNVILHSDDTGFLPCLKRHVGKFVSFALGATVGGFVVYIICNNNNPPPGGSSGDSGTLTTTPNIQPTHHTMSSMPSSFVPTQSTPIFKPDGLRDGFGFAGAPVLPMDLSLASEVSPTTDESPSSFQVPIPSESPSPPPQRFKAKITIPINPATTAPYEKHVPEHKAKKKKGKQTFVRQTSEQTITQTGTNATTPSTTDNSSIPEKEHVNPWARWNPPAPGEDYTLEKAEYLVDGLNLLFRAGGLLDFAYYEPEGNDCSGTNRGINIGHVRDYLKKLTQKTISEAEIFNKVLGKCKTLKTQVTHQPVCHIVTDLNNNESAIPIHLIPYSDVIAAKFNGPLEGEKDTINLYNGWHTFVLLGIAACQEKPADGYPANALDHFLGNDAYKTLTQGHILPDFWNYLYDAYYLQINVENVFNIFAEVYVDTFDIYFKDTHGASQIDLEPLGDIPEDFPEQHAQDFLRRTKDRFKIAAEKQEYRDGFMILKEQYEKVCEQLGEIPPQPSQQCFEAKITTPINPKIDDPYEIYLPEYKAKKKKVEKTDASQELTFTGTLETKPPPPKPRTPYLLLTPEEQAERRLENQRRINAKYTQRSYLT